MLDRFARILSLIAIFVIAGSSVGWLFKDQDVYYKANAVFQGGPPIFTTSEAALTAHAGGTQAAALALDGTKFLHQVTTVGSAADSVALPLPAVTGTGAPIGQCHLIANEAATNSMQLYAVTPATINGAATATGIAVAAKKGELCCAISAADYLCAGI